MAKKMDRVGKALRATRQLTLKTKAAGPLNLRQLRQEIDARLSSRGGRPSDPEWKLRRSIPFKEDSWNFLREKGKEVGADPGQLAAILLEREIESLKKEKPETQP